MKRFILSLILTFAYCLAQAQLYVPGETLHYKMSYRAKLFPNTEVANVVMQTTETTLDTLGHTINLTLDLSIKLITYSLQFQYPSSTIPHG